MISVDIAQLELLSEDLSKASSDSEEILGRLRSLYSEMQNDLELPLYTQHDALLESVSLAIDALNRGNSSLTALRSVIHPAAEQYLELEKSNIAALNRMTVHMESVSTGFREAVLSESIPSAEHSPLTVSQNRLQELVTGSAEELQIANIAAVSDIVRKEYNIRSVEDLDESN